jgi:hypothetical protein
VQSVNRYACGERSTKLVFEAAGLLPRLVAVAIFCPAITASLARAGEVPKPDLTAFSRDMRSLVTKYYPEASVTLQDQRIHFEYRAREYMIHEPNKMGEWQDARPEKGPTRGGIYGDVSLRPGRYEGTAEVPQLIDERYFKLLLLAPYSRKLDHHLYVRLEYPSEASKDFLREFESLVNNFEATLSSTGP